MGARYPYYTLADSAEGQREEARLSGSEPKQTPTFGNIREGFVYQRVPPHHPQGHRPQHRDRRDLGPAPTRR